MDDSQLYLSFEDFKLWLNKYSFVRDMVREALMPKIWSLKDHKNIPEINISSNNQNQKNSPIATKRLSTVSLRHGASNSPTASMNIT